MKQSLAPNKLHILFMSFPSDEHDARNSPRPRLVTQGTFTYALLRDVCGGGDKGPACGRAGPSRTFGCVSLEIRRMPPREARVEFWVCALSVCACTQLRPATRVCVYGNHTRSSHVCSDPILNWLFSSVWPPAFVWVGTTGFFIFRVSYLIIVMPFRCGLPSTMTSLCRNYDRLLTSMHTRENVCGGFDTDRTEMTQQQGEAGHRGPPVMAHNGRLPLQRGISVFDLNRILIFNITIIFFYFLFIDTFLIFMRIILPHSIFSGINNRY